jgi:hypothetical protein
MRKIILEISILLFAISSMHAQIVVKGIVLDADSEKYLQAVVVTVKNTRKNQLTSFDGAFVISDLSRGHYVLEIKLRGYETQNFPIELANKTIDLGVILLFKDVTENFDLSTIILTDDELNNDASAADNISGLLQATRDVYLRTAAFEFGASFFRVRGLDSENGIVSINGIEMNKLFNGRPQWGNWGGLNAVTRNQEFSDGLSPSNFTFGGLLGATNMNITASDQRPGVRITYSSSNRSYLHRIMASYASGLNKKGFAFTIAASKRVGDEGFNDGTSYNATSVFTSIEKKINETHSLNFTGIFAPNKRGKSSPNTQEVYDLKGIQYNSYWGYQNGNIRNSRYKELIEPILMLNHYWTVNKKTSINTNIGYQFGGLANSRIDFGGTDLNMATGFSEGGAPNPDPTYYQKLPSYAFRNSPNNLEIAFGLQNNFINNAQLDWPAIYRANTEHQVLNNGNSIYVQYEDRTEDKQFTINSILNATINDHISINGKLIFRSLKSDNFAEVIDLLGGTGFLDVDGFADDLTNNPNAIQNDLLNPNKIVGVGDTFRYSYNIDANVISGFAQAQFKYNTIDFYTAVSITNTSYQREGIYKNGGFENNSLGKGEKLSFTGIAAKAGAIYKLTGRHLFDVNAAYITKAPSIRNTYTNSRENHDFVPNITEEKITSFDGSYILRAPLLQARVRGYYTKIEDANEVSFFFADGIGGDNTAFVQEILQGIAKKHFGVELGLEYQILATVKLKGVASFGQYTYNNNPNLFLSSEDFDQTLELGKAALKDYKLATGPQQAYSVGFEYRDPNYWWFGATANFMSNAYIDISPLQRSANFYTDFDGLVFNEYDAEIARELLAQEKIKKYMVVNLVGGKSFKIKKSYVSLFASVNNLLDVVYKTGGFEQGRNANYRQLLEDKSLDTQVFGPKYWYGRGTTYFLNLNYSF